MKTLNINTGMSLSYTKIMFIEDAKKSNLLFKNW